MGSECGISEGFVFSAPRVGHFSRLEFCASGGLVTFGRVPFVTTHVSSSWFRVRVPHFSRLEYYPTSAGANATSGNTWVTGGSRRAFAPLPYTLGACRGCRRQA